MNIAFFGTPEPAVHFLHCLIEQGFSPDDVAFMVTQPDRPVGRKQILTPSPVKKFAVEHGIRIFDEYRGQRDTIAKALRSVDVAILFAFGEIIPQNILDAPKYGFWNVHPSMLPAFRGASPTVYPLILGEKSTGVTLMQMDAELDHGPIIQQKTFEIPEKMKNEDLLHVLVGFGAEMVSKNLKKLVTSEVRKHIQPHEKATYTRPLTRNDGYVDATFVKLAMQGALLDSQDKIKLVPAIIREFFEKNEAGMEKFNNDAADVVYNFFQGMHPWPGVWTKTEVNGQEKRVKLLDMELKNGLNTHLHLKTIQIEGKSPIEYNAQLHDFI